MRTSESRKRAAEEAAATHERRREVTQQALERVYAGASFTEADALLDQLEDLDASVVVW